MKKLVGYLKEINRQRNHKTKELKRRIKLLSLSRQLQDKRREKIDTSNIKRILFPFVDLGIGDAVCHTGTWHALKQAGYTIQIVAEERNRDLFEKMADIDEVYIADVKNIDAMKPIETDLVISHYSWMKRKELFTTQLLRKINYKYAIGFGGWLAKPFNLMLPINSEFHITHPQKNILSALNVTPERLCYSLPALPEHERFIDSYLEPHAGKRIVVLNPFASVAERSLSIPQLHTLATEIVQSPDTQVFIIGEGGKLADLHFDNANITVCRFKSLWDAITLIKKADLVVSVDTAIVHIACAFDKKLIAIYFSMLLDHNKDYEGNTIFSPIGQNSEQLIYDKRNNKIDIEDIAAKVARELRQDRAVA
ncbi:MAG: lipopolysaccharide heptosyltransferase family protein [Enterobacter sp.]|jgi:ADP-heptose:LPS heptosyltransferase|nr:lipopolysaccharide heptosyltransferase family protein [Enterobacter sp.]